MKTLQKNLIVNGSLKRIRWYFAAGIMLLVAALIAHIWDIPYKNWIQQYTYLKTKGTIFRDFLEIITFLGKGGIVVILALIMGGIGKSKLCWRIIIAFLIMAAIVLPLKKIVHRERPNGTNHLSFPSGDTADATVLFVSLASYSPAMTPVAAVMIPAVGILRTYNNLHYLSDVLAGMAIGIMAVGIAITIKPEKNKYLKKIKPRYYALAAMAVTLVCFIPQAFKNGGEYLSFLELVGPPLFIYLASKYSPLFFVKNIRIDTRFSKFFHFRKRFTITISKVVLSHKNFFFNKYLWGTISAISLVLVFLDWTEPKLYKLRLAATGMALGFLVLSYLVRKEVKVNKPKSASVTLIHGFCLLLVFFLITYIPSTVRHNTASTDQYASHHYHLIQIP